MAGLLDSIFNTPEGRLGIGLLSMAGPQSRPMGVGERIAGALQQQDAYKQQLAEQESNKLRNEFQAEQMAGMRRKNSREDAAMQAAMRKQQALSGLWSGGSPALAPLMGDAESGILPSAGQPATLGQLDVQAALRAGYSPEEIEKLASLRNVGLDEVARTMTGMQNGREVSQQFDKFGRPVGQGMEQFRAPIMQNLGNETVALNPFSLQKMQSFAMGMTPGQAASNNIALQNLGLSRARFDFDKEKNKAEGGANGYTFNAAAGGYVPKNPSLEFIPLKGAPAQNKGNVTEGERKAETLRQRMEGSLNQLQSVTKENPGAASPSLLAETARKIPLFGGDNTANAVMGSDRQRVEAAQLDILDAALTLGTGAAYTKEQLEGYRRSFFPQPFDSEETVKDKKDRLDNILRSARTAAGRAAPAETPRQPVPSQDASGKVGGVPDDIKNLLGKYTNG